MSVLTPLSANDQAPDSLDLFSVPSNQIAIQSQFYDDIRPVSQFQQTPVLEFDTTLHGDVYINLLQTKLFLKVRILKSDGSKLTAADKVAPVNLFFHALFKQCDVYLNRTLVSSSGDLYPIKSYLKRLLTTSAEEKSTRLQAELFYRDSPGFIDETDPLAGNQGLFERHLLCEESKQFDMVGFPLNDALQLDRFMINGVHLRIVMLRTQPEFCLMSDDGEDGYKISIENAFLRLIKLRINPGILESHSKILKEVSCKYPYVKTDLKIANIIAGQNSFAWDMINPSYLPRLVVVAFVESTAVTGSFLKSPFNLQNFDLKRLSVMVNGVSTPGAPIQVDFDNDNKRGQTVMEVFDRIFDTNSRKHEVPGAISGSDRLGFGVKREDINGGYTLYIFDLEPVLNDNMQFDLLRTGTLSLNALFGTPLPVNVTCLLYHETYAMIEIDESRVIKLT